MSRSRIIEQHLPFLRRYARALTGSQSSGDAYVVATLEAMVADPSLLTGGDSLRVELFQLFTNIWSPLSVSDDPETANPSLPPEQRLVNLTPPARQASLLMAVERFSEEQCAKILDCDIATVHRLIGESGRELAAEIATNVLIIEDETLIAIELEELIENLGHTSIGVARTHTEAVILASTKQPGLILADIQLADGSSGLDAVKELLLSFEAPVVFITAYPERFLTGDRPEPAFLISKPFQPAMVSAIASQALFFDRKARQRVSRIPA
jgi:DNA-directed RNA polymerase specialized sigma24 family protein